MKFFKILFVTIFVLILVAIVGAYVFLKTTDINKYTPHIIKEVQKKTGRNLVVGNASIKMSLVPTVLVEDVSFGNASWAKKSKMIEARKVEIQFAIMPLLKKKVVVKNFVLDGAKVYLQTNTDGKGNWVFDKPEQAPKKSFNLEIISSANAQSINKDVPNIELESILINRGIVSFNDHTVDIKSLDLSMPNKDSVITTTFDLSYNGHAVSGNSKLGSLNNLLDKNAAYPVDLKVIYKKIGVEFAGNLINAMAGNVFASGNVNVYNPSGNMSLPETSLRAFVEASDKMLDVDVKVLNIADNLIIGRVHANLENKPFVDAFFASDKINLETLQQTKPLAFKLPSLVSEANATTLVKETPIDYSLLRLVDGKMQIDVKEFVINEDFVFNNLKTTANLNDGNLLIKPFDVNIKDGKIFLTASVDAKSQKMNANIKSENLKIQDFDKEFLIVDDKDFGIVSGGGIDVDANIITQGKTTKALLENLDGRAIVIANKSVIQTGNSALLDGFIGTVFNAIKLSNPKANKEVDLSCAVIRTDIKNGVLNFPKGIAMQSNNISLYANGYVSLGNDKIALDLHPYVKDLANTGIASTLGSLLKISGSIQKPKVAIDEKQAIKTLVGVLATGGASYVGSQVVDAGNSSCYTALIGTGYESKFPKPAVATQVIDKSAQTVENSAKQTIKDLGNTAKELINLF